MRLHNMFKKDRREDHIDSFTKQKKAGSTGRNLEKNVINAVRQS